MGYRSVRWTQHPGGGVAKKVARRVVRHAQAGSIISLDAWRKSHRTALGQIVDGLRKRHFDLRTIETLERVHAVRWDVTLSQGSSGPEVAYLQKTLGSISYPAGKRDGSFGYATYQATVAFEKTRGMARDGVVDPSEMTKIALASRPRTPKGKGKNFIDIDISRQVLFEVRKGRVINTLPISSGNEEYYEQDGRTYKAHTPRGDFIIERKIPGWRTSRLGRLYYPSYFVGGFAIHGSESVPTYPASHGCVRVPMYIAKPFYNRNPIGRKTYVHN
jgi:lipoprotein-anchoring transpeptidase ErfK/SrfK